MDFGLSGSKRPSARDLRPAVWPTLFCVSSVIVALVSLGSQTTCGRSDIPPPTQEVSAYNEMHRKQETFLPGRLLVAFEEARFRRATHFGIVKNGIVVDPEPELMEALRKYGRPLRPASELAKASQANGDFCLVTADRVRWESPYRACVDGTLYYGKGGVIAMRLVREYSRQPSCLDLDDSYFQVTPIVTKDRITILSKGGKQVTLSL
jgi:hypothetical protein